jgi:Flp pilus assembly protein TadG
MTTGRRNGAGALPGKAQPRRAMTLARRLAKERSGATIIEFALVFPILLFMVMAIIQICWVFMATQHFENATADLGRMVRTGRVQDQGLGQEAFRTILCARLVPLMSCDDGNFRVDVQVIPDFGPVSLEPPIDEDGRFVGSGSFQVGGGGEVVLVRAFYQFPVWLPVIGSMMSNVSNGRRMLVSTAAFRNEPF